MEMALVMSNYCAQCFIYAIHVLVQKLSRTYAQAVAGYTQSMSFDADSKKFILKYITSKASLSLRTEVQLYFILMCIINWLLWFRYT